MINNKTPCQDCNNIIIYNHNGTKPMFCRNCKLRKNREWYYNNKDKANKKHKEWLENNKKRVKDTTIKYRNKNREKINSNKRAYYYKNINKVREINRLYYNNRRIGGDEITSDDWQKIKDAYDNRCIKCGKSNNLTIDHIIPVSKGGKNSIKNIQPLCQSCNSKKYNKYPKTILTAGTFDLLHKGHINILKKSRMLGDRLIVMLSTEDFNKKKGKKSLMSYKDRKQILESLVYVNKVVPETSWEDKAYYIEKFNVNTFTIGSDWEGHFDYLPCEVVIFPRTEGVSSTKLRGKK